jgi:hypothetical protein
MITFGFVCLGFLIGNLTGLSSDGVTRALLPPLFAFGGGSAVAFMQKVQPDVRRRAAAAIVALSLSCLVGVYSGIVVAEYQWLSPDSEKALEVRVSVGARKYLKEHLISPAKTIDTKLSSGELTAEQAYDQLHRLLTTETERGKQ